MRLDTYRRRGVFPNFLSTRVGDVDRGKGLPQSKINSTSAELGAGACVETRRPEMLRVVTGDGAPANESLTPLKVPEMELLVRRIAKRQ